MERASERVSERADEQERMSKRVEKRTLNRLIASKHHYFLDILFIFICFSYSASHLARRCIFVSIRVCVRAVKCGWSRFKSEPSEFVVVLCWHGICARILIAEMWRASESEREKTHAYTLYSDHSTK